MTTIEANRIDPPASAMRLIYGLDVRPLIELLDVNPDLWEEFTARQEVQGSAHKDARCIVLLGPVELSVEGWFTDLESVPWPPFQVLGGAIRGLVAPLLKSLDVTGADKIGRLMLAELKPGGRIEQHIDEGEYADYYTRFHIPITSEPGNWFECGDWGYHMLPGEAWWFNHKLPHAVNNNSASPRVHLIIDVRMPPIPENLILVPDRKIITPR